MEWPFRSSEVLDLLGYHGKIYSGKMDIPCPYCGDDKRHLNFNLNKNQFRCNRCGAFGNTLQFYQYMMDLPNCKEAYWSIMERLNLKEIEPVVKKQRIEKIQEEKKKVTTLPLLDIVSRHETYQAILNHLTLEDYHVEDLKKRGLSDMEIMNLDYKSFPGNLDNIMNCLYDEGVSFLGVPGFYEYYGKIKFIREKKGILIPVRNFNGYIEGLQLRIDNSERDMDENGKLSPKYKWISSSSLYKGSGGSAIHYACEFRWDKKMEEFYPFIGPDKTIYLTEGPMKGDITHFLSDYRLPIIAVPGVNHITKLETELTNIQKLGVVKIVLMYDMDYKNNPHVQKALEKTREVIKKFNFHFAQLEWDEKYKGIDDYFLHRKGKSV